MNARPIRRRILTQAVSEGAGVEVRRSIGVPALRHLDPFLMLDHFSSDDPDDYIAGFPDHPHRGFVTLTYMIDGHMLHRDSMGNQGDLRAGGVQWMKAASGVIHSEMPQQSAGLMRGFQLWINLPASEKMSEPAYQEFGAEAIPRLQEHGLDMRVLMGEHAGLRGPILDPHTRVRYLDIRLAAGRDFTIDLDPRDNAFVYVFEGKADIAGALIPAHQLLVLGEGDGFALTAGADGVRFILVSGLPLGEPVVQYGPFVMNSREEVEQALADYRDGRLVRSRAHMATG